MPSEWPSSWAMTASVSYWAPVVVQVTLLLKEMSLSTITWPDCRAMTPRSNLFTSIEGLLINPSRYGCGKVGIEAEESLPSMECGARHGKGVTQSLHAMHATTPPPEEGTVSR